MWRRYPVIIYSENGAYRAEFPDLPGRYTQADSLVGVMENAKDAKDAYLSSRRVRGQKIPDPSDLSLRFV